MKQKFSSPFSIRNSAISILNSYHVRSIHYILIIFHLLKCKAHLRYCARLLIMARLLSCARVVTVLSHDAFLHALFDVGVHEQLVIFKMLQRILHIRISYKAYCMHRTCHILCPPINHYSQGMKNTHTSRHLHSHILILPHLIF